MLPKQTPEIISLTPESHPCGWGSTWLHRAVRHRRRHGYDQKNLVFPSPRSEDGCIEQTATTAGTVVDTTGAGDCFTAAFATAAQEGQEPQEALRFAAAAAGICVTVPGALPSLPWRADVDKLLG